MSNMCKNKDNARLIQAGMLEMHKTWGIKALLTS